MRKYFPPRYLDANRGEKRVLLFGEIRARVEVSRYMSVIWFILGTRSRVARISMRILEKFCDRDFGPVVRGLYSSGLKSFEEFR